METTITVYGIPNCNTVKKARVWLEEQGLSYTFHDFKKAGITIGKLEQWTAFFGWETVLNKKGTTWRKLSPEMQHTVKDSQSAIAILLANNSAIKRPVIERNGQPVLISFDAIQYAATLS